jgi:hypothetical protein
MEEKVFKGATIETASSLTEVKVLAVTFVVDVSE